jgi:hypothetical protein
MRVTVHVPDEIGEAAQELADAQDQSVSSFYADAVEDRVKQLRRQQAFDRIEKLIEKHPPPASDAIEELHRMRDEPDRTFD